MNFSTNLFMLFSKERFETGRMYVFNADHVNSHGTWLEQVDTTNLCVEVTHPLKPIYNIEDANGEIGVCILAAVNLLEIKDNNDMELTCDVIVRMLDELIDHQNYFAPAAANFAKKRRSLGIGITNLAAVFAREGVKYWDKKAPNLAARLMESVSYYLLSASADLAQEKGPCDKYSLTKFSKGVLPIDTYKKEIDEFVTEKLHQDWEALREKIAKTGIRNSTLTALMPCESSAVIQSSTNGIEPPRSLITSKRSKAGIVPSVVPGVEKYGESKISLLGYSQGGIVAVELGKGAFEIINLNPASKPFYNTKGSDNEYIIKGSTDPISNLNPLKKKSGLNLIWPRSVLVLSAMAQKKIYHMLLITL